MAEDKGLPMTSRVNPEKLALEVAQLEELKTKPLLPKTWGYIKRSGPGLLQSAMTLGAGSATGSVLAGAAFGYKLLWVQPLAMFLGVCMLAALSNVVLTTKERPYKAFARETSILLVFLWALGTILASVIWHFPQYTLAAGAVRDLTSMVSSSPLTTQDASQAFAIGSWVSKYTPFGAMVSVLAGILVLGINIITVWSYGSSQKGVKFYEWFLRFIIALIIVSFAIVVVFNLHDLNWTEIGKGFCGWYTTDVLFPGGKLDSTALVTILGMLGAAVGINMTFLYPYSLLAKGWGPEHKTVAKWDLGMSMFLPFVLVTSLIIMAMTVGKVYPYAGDVSKLKPLEASQALVDILGNPGRIIFDLGLIGMALGAISAHMVVCGFTVCEMFQISYTKWRFRLFAMLPSIGILGVLIDLPFWLPVVASAVCFTMLPIAYLLFFIMNNKRSYIGDAVGCGPKRWIFNTILLIALVFSVIGSAIAINDRVIKKLRKPAAAPAAVEAAPVETVAE